MGINLDDGGALMAFRMRDARRQPRWAAATLRSADGTVQTFEPDDVAVDAGPDAGVAAHRCRVSGRSGECRSATASSTSSR